MAKAKAARGDPAAVQRILAKLYPDATCALTFENPLQLLIKTILSAQCTDATVNRIAPALFARLRTAKDFADADPDELKELIRSTGFFNSKARAIQVACAQIVDDFGGEVPETMEQLTSLHGVARKTANVVLGTAFGKSEGIVVDTHVIRLAHRMGLSKEKDPVKIERDLMAAVPRRDWTVFGHRVTTHGRRLCVAKQPKCDECPVLPHCPQIGV
jgi:endonuclease-3